MPIITVETNLGANQLPADFLSTLSAFSAETLDKPEQVRNVFSDVIRIIITQFCFLPLDASARRHFYIILVIFNIFSRYFVMNVLISMILDSCRSDDAKYDIHEKIWMFFFLKMLNRSWSVIGESTVVKEMRYDGVTFMRLVLFTTVFVFIYK